jgi:outer membrane protein TolC
MQIYNLLYPYIIRKLYGGIEASKIAAELSELQYKKTAEQIYFEISTLYYNAQLLHHQLEFIDSNLNNAERLLKNMQLLNEQLLAKGTDVGKVKLQVAQLNTQKVAIISSKYTQVLNGLKFAMGIAPETPVAIDPTIQIENEKETKSIQILDIEIVNTQKKLLRTELSTLNKSRFLPTLNVVGSYGTTGFGYDKKPNDFIKFFPVGFAGLQLSYPLFNGTVTQRKINQKKIELQNNELQTKLLNEQNNMQIENASLQRVVTRKSVATISEQIALAKTIYEQTIIQQKQGTASLSRHIACGQ